LTPSLDLSCIVQETLGPDAEHYSLLEALEEMGEPGCASQEVIQADHAYPLTIKPGSDPLTAEPVVEVKPHETKKQAIRRVKNNAASKVCRRTRKNKQKDMCALAQELSDKNKSLMREIGEVESLVRLLKEHLVKATKKH